MGFLTVKGTLMTYDEYKAYIGKYKERGLLEFLEIYRAQKDKHRERRDLHWGEEMEYILFHLDKENKRVRLSNNAFDLLHEFNEEGCDEIDLHPEFGNWMVEAVPTKPYGATEDIDDMLTCYPKIQRR